MKDTSFSVTFIILIQASAFCHMGLMHSVIFPFKNDIRIFPFLSCNFRKFVLFHYCFHFIESVLTLKNCSISCSSFFLLPNRRFLVIRLRFLLFFILYFLMGWILMFYLFNGMFPKNRSLYRSLLCFLPRFWGKLFDFLFILLFYW